MSVDLVTIIPGVRRGCPTIRGMQITVSEVLEMLVSDMPEPDVLEAFPDLEAEDIHAALQYASRNFDHPVVTG